MVKCVFPFAPDFLGHLQSRTSDLTHRCCRIFLLPAVLVPGCFPPGQLRGAWAAFSPHLLPHLEVILTGKHGLLPKLCGEGQKERVRVSMGKQELINNKAATHSHSQFSVNYGPGKWLLKIQTKTTTKCSLENPFLENLLSIGTVFESKD